MRTTLLTLIAIGAAIAPLAVAAERESKATDRLDAAADVLSDMTKASDKGIPQDLLNRAKCVVVVPNMKKAGFVWGAKYGRGYAMCRNTSGNGWTAPAGMRIEGGSFGLQIGGSEMDVVLLINSDKGMRHLLEDKFTMGGDANVSAGPVGRDASAQTDAALHAEILSYSRSRGIFAGLSLEGATLRPDKDADRELYGRDVTAKEILTGSSVAVPPAAEKLEHTIDRDSARAAR